MVAVSRRRQGDMANPSKNKGTTFETLMVNYFKQFWPRAERRALSGALDKGDVSGLPVPLELKNCKSIDLAGWTKEAKKEAENALAPFCPVIHNRRGKGDPALQWVTIEAWVLVELLLAWERDVA